MKWIALAAACALCLSGETIALAQGSGAPGVSHAVFTIPGGGTMTYGIAVPRGPGPHPLILALHPGGGRTAYYGSSFMRSIVEPALRDWNAIIVAPDAPTRSWASDVSERAIVALLEEVMAKFSIDRARVLVTGFSLGGHGTWFFATHRADLFTGAIPIAGSPGDEPLEALGDMPVHIIHSRDDEVVPFRPAADAATHRREGGHPVEFTELEGVGHFTMGAYIQPLQRAGAWMMEQWKRK